MNDVLAPPRKSRTNGGVRLGSRDHAILAGLFAARIMKREHMTEIFFEGKDPAAKKRVGLLAAAGYIAEYGAQRLPNEPAIYRLTHKGFDVLAAEGLLDGFRGMAGRAESWTSLDERHKVSPMTVGHELGVIDVWAALVRCVRGRADVQIADALTWPLLMEFRVDDPECQSGTRVVRPDGFFRATRQMDGGRNVSSAYFLELDCGSEKQATLVGKIRGYRAYNRSPAFARFLTGSDAGDYAFRVLIVFKTANEEGAEERLFNHAHALFQLEPPVRTLVLMTTHERAVKDPLGAIWLSPGDYAGALSGTPFDPAGNWTPRTRSRERDQLARERARRRRLFPQAEVTP